LAVDIALVCASCADGLLLSTGQRQSATVRQFDSRRRLADVQCQQFLAADTVPKTNGAIFADGNQAFAIRAECEPNNWLAVAAAGS
jgi:hypothetical protein